jgi:DNA-binding MarR family transcriptional regulator
MKYDVFPIRKELEAIQKNIPEINPASVVAMLRILQTDTAIHDQIFKVLEQQHQLSEGKLSVMMVLYEHPEGVAPSILADNAGVSRATISVMLQRMMRDNLISTTADNSDARGKVICLSPEGRKFMDGILPNHFLRISKVMGRLNQDEQEQLILLLQKLVHEPEK